MLISDLKAVLPVKIWTEPDDQGEIVFNAIKHAKYSVDIVVYSISGSKMLDALQTAKKNGVSIRIMLNGQFFVGNDPSSSIYQKIYSFMDELNSSSGNGKVSFHWACNNFEITHQKTILIDTRKNEQGFIGDALPASACALVLTLNLDSYLGITISDTQKGDRDFGVLISDPIIVSQIAFIFESDFSCAGATTTNSLKNSNDGLVWSNGSTDFTCSDKGSYPIDGVYPFPVNLDKGINQGNARALHLAIIKGAQKSLTIYNEEMNDDEIVSALVDAANRGIAIRMLIPGNVSSSNEYYYDYNYALLAPTGAKVRLSPSCDQYIYIHAKVILADANTELAIAYMGSQNISPVSLNYNRELRVILKGDDTQLFIDTFDHDWQIKGFIQWPSDGSSASVDDNPSNSSISLTKREPSLAINSSEAGTDPDDIPMSCGSIEPNSE
ncbi:MAG: hypothetical protein GY817_05700 [bacterium]|nr:hypothetical protein [bacterium]